MSDAKVAWLGRALGSAARRSANVVRLPRDLVRRALQKRERPAQPSPGDARIRGGRIEYDRGLGPRRTYAPTADVSTALCHPDPAVRVRALRALCALSERRASHLVAPMLHDPNPAVRAAAADTAAEVRATEAVFSLILGLEDGERAVRDACHDAITTITGRTPWHGQLDEHTLERKVVELRAWWKEERMSLLARSAYDDASR